MEHGMERAAETPATFAELKPPGYWHGKRFVRVRRLAPAEAEEKYREMEEWFEGTPWQLAERFRRKLERRKSAA